MLRLSHVLFSALAFVLVVGQNASAADITKNSVRNGDPVHQYVLQRQNPKQFRAVYRNGNRNVTCTITQGVASFKLSQHPRDAAYVYYVQNGNLYYLRQPPRLNGGNCPGFAAVRRGPIARNVKEYGVISNSNQANPSTLINMALTNGGQLSVWGNAGRPIVSRAGVDDMVYNNNYGVAGRPFQTYAIFYITRGGTVYGIRGGLGGARVEVNRQGQFKDLTAFRRARGLIK